MWHNAHEALQTALGSHCCFPPHIPVGALLQALEAQKAQTRALCWQEGC